MPRMKFEDVDKEVTMKRYEIKYTAAGEHEVIEIDGQSRKLIAMFVDSDEAVWYMRQKIGKAERDAGIARGHIVPTSAEIDLHKFANEVFKRATGA